MTLKELREQANLSRYAMAKKTNLVEKTLQNLEEGRTTPHRDTIIKIAEILNTSVEEIDKAIEESKKEVVE